jgi:hypothetical protein
MGCPHLNPGRQPLSCFVGIFAVKHKVGSWSPDGLGNEFQNTGFACPGKGIDDHDRVTRRHGRDNMLLLDIGLKSVLWHGKDRMVRMGMMSRWRGECGWKWDPLCCQTEKQAGKTRVKDERLASTKWFSGRGTLLKGVEKTGTG